MDLTCVGCRNTYSLAFNTMLLFCQKIRQARDSLSSSAVARDFAISVKRKVCVFRFSNNIFVIRMDKKKVSR